MNEKTTTRITDVRTVGIPVTDQERALDFYVGKLGFEKRMDVPFGPGQRWVEVAPPGAGTTIALVSAGQGAPAGVDTGIRLVTGDAAADHADLRSRGVDADAEILNMGGAPPMFTFRDQDGNRLVVVQGS
ncbi:MAG TPA: VOC family protein [Terriglobales bacterium]|nr:VOC family protein [Terriglobales bacterium]